MDLVSAIRDHTHSPRTLLGYLENLPDTSALSSVIRGEPRGWGQDRHLAATIIDAIQANTWVTAAASSKRKPPKPKRINRPKQRAKPRVLRVADLAKGR